MYSYFPASSDSQCLPHVTHSNKNCVLLSLTDIPPLMMACGDEGTHPENWREVHSTHFVCVRMMRSSVTFPRPFLIKAYSHRERYLICTWVAWRNIQHPAHWWWYWFCHAPPTPRNSSFFTAFKCYSGKASKAPVYCWKDFMEVFRVIVLDCVIILK
jgi:hypothetical protein